MSADTQERPPVPWEVHFGLQAEFVKLAKLLAVEIKDGEGFTDALEQCKARARAASAKADKYEKVLALVDGAADAFQFGKEPDIRRARSANGILG